MCVMSPPGTSRIANTTKRARPSKIKVKQVECPETKYADCVEVISSFLIVSLFSLFLYY